MQGIRLKCRAAAAAWLIAGATMGALLFTPHAASAASADAANVVNAANVATSGDERLALRDHMARLVAAGRYAEIVARAEADIAEGKRLSDGTWRGYETYMAFEEGLWQRPVDDPLWPALLNDLRERSQRRPGDVFLYVQALHAYAWKVRGGGVIGGVSALQRQSFGQLMAAAREALDTNRPALIASPMWFAQRTTVANELGEGQQSLRALFQEGIRRFPDFHPIVLTRVRALTPKWGGSEDALMDLLDTVAAMPEPALKEGLYARVVWVAEDEDEMLFLDPRFKPALWRASFDAMLARWPDARIRQRYFFQACEMSERAIAQSQLAAMAQPIVDKRLARNIGTIGHCREWAGSGEPFLLRVRHRGEVKEILVN